MAAGGVRALNAEVVRSNLLTSRFCFASFRGNDPRGARGAPIRTAGVPPKDPGFALIVSVCVAISTISNDVRAASLRVLLGERKLCRIIEVHSPLAAIVAEHARGASAPERTFDGSGPVR